MWRKSQTHPQGPVPKIHELSGIVGIGYGTCQDILTDNLGLCYVAAKFVPRLLLFDQKQRHGDVCLELQDMDYSDRLCGHNWK